MFSATTSCDVMWVTPDSGSTECGYPAASRADDSRSEWATNTLSSASPWMISSGRTRVAHRPFRIVDDGAHRVGGGIARGVTQVALGVVRVVEPPVGDRRARDPGVEHVRAAQHGERGQVAAERPAAHGDAARCPGRRTLRPPPAAPSPGPRGRPWRSRRRSPGPRPGRGRRSPAVRHDDREPLLGEPLGGEEDAGGLHHPLLAGPAVGVHEHRQPACRAGARTGRARRCGCRPGPPRGTAARVRQVRAAAASDAIRCGRAVPGAVLADRDRQVVAGQVRRASTVVPPAAVAVCTPGSVATSVSPPGP